MAYFNTQPQLTGGDTPAEPGNPRTFPELYNTLLQAIVNAFNNVDIDTTALESSIGNLQTQIDNLQIEINTVQSNIDAVNDDLQAYKAATDARLDALEASPE